jgi:uncharacterized membrane-anchored protein YhcB (DUF1043 family)
MKPIVTFALITITIAIIVGLIAQEYFKENRKEQQEKQKQEYRDSIELELAKIKLNYYKNVIQRDTCRTMRNTK